jgi:hypothetical protein
MERPLSGWVSRLSAAVALIAAAPLAARADALPSYSVTDLGVGTATLSTGTDGQGVVIAPDGRAAYAFPRTFNAVANPQAILQALPPLTNAPVWDPMTYGNPKYAYSYFTTSGAFLNKNGLFVGTDIVGVSGHIASAGSYVDSSQRQADGTFGPLATLWSSPNNLYSGGQIAQALDLNNRNQVLGITAAAGSTPIYGYNYYLHSFLLFDPKTGTTSLDALAPGWHIDSAIALDDQGRILITADQGAQDPKTHSLLLTPADAAPDPVPVPEPTSLATLLIGLGYAALRGLGQRAPRRSSCL